MPSRLESGQSIVFIGDSITDCERRVSSNSALGNGYVRIFSDMLLTREPEKAIRIVNKGIDSNTIGHLLSRWQDDVVEQHPDHLFILIGINDATRFLDRSSSLHCAPSAFRATYQQLIDETRSRLPECRITLMQPFFISPGDNIVGSYRAKLIATLADYIDTTDALAREFGLSLVPLQQTFQALLCYKNSDFYSEDKIHPTLTGHHAIAEAVYRSLHLKDA